MKIPINSNDRLYADLRDLNFTVVGPRLNKKAKEIDEYYNVTGNAHGHIMTGL